MSPAPTTPRSDAETAKARRRVVELLQEAMTADQHAAEARALMNSHEAKARRRLVEASRLAATLRSQS